MRHLEGKAVVVTGAARGIGAAYAEGLAAMGAAVVANDIDGAPVVAVAEKISRSGGRAVAHLGDITDEVLAAALMERCVAEFGAIDGLVNNAGLFIPGRLDELRVAD